MRVWSQAVCSGLCYWLMEQLKHGAEFWCFHICILSGGTQTVLCEDFLSLIYTELNTHCFLNDAGLCDTSCRWIWLKQIEIAVSSFLQKWVNLILQVIFAYFNKKLLNRSLEQMEKDTSVSRVLLHYNFCFVQLLYLSIPCT